MNKIADTIRSLKPGDRVRVTFEDTVFQVHNLDGGIRGVGFLGRNVWPDDPTITSIEVIERPLQVGDRVYLSRLPDMKGVIRATDDGDAWVRWDIPQNMRAEQPLSDLRRAS